MVHFGLDGSRVSNLDLEYFNNKIKERNSSCQLKWLAETKKEGTIDSWTRLLDNIVSAPIEKHLVHLSISLEAIAGLKGVSTNCLTSGIPSDDVITMVFEAGLRLGKFDMLKSVDISDYNPFVED